MNLFTKYQETCGFECKVHPLELLNILHQPDIEPMMALQTGIGGFAIGVGAQVSVIEERIILVHKCTVCMVVQ